ncbi:uncharacterized protein LOC144141625 [Haemaphysalis longicornis]
MGQRLGCHCCGTNERDEGADLRPNFIIRLEAQLRQARRRARAIAKIEGGTVSDPSTSSPDTFSDAVGGAAAPKAPGSAPEDSGDEDSSCGPGTAPRTFRVQIERVPSSVLSTPTKPT